MQTLKFQALTLNFKFEVKNAIFYIKNNIPLKVLYNLNTAKFDFIFLFFKRNILFTFKQLKQKKKKKIFQIFIINFNQK